MHVRSSFNVVSRDWWVVISVLQSILYNYAYVYGCFNWLFGVPKSVSLCMRPHSQILIECVRLLLLHIAVCITDILTVDFFDN